MRCERLRAVFGTLRFRLMAWNALVMLLVVGLALVAVREAVHLALLAELDGYLEEDAAEVALAVRHFAPRLEPVCEELTRKAQGHKGHAWFVQLCDAGRVVWASPGGPTLELPAAGARRATAGDFRVCQHALNVPGAPALVRVGSSLAPIHEDVALLTEKMLLGGGLMLLVVPLSAYWLAGRATRPLDRIIRTAEQLRPGRLAERLPDRGTGDELDRLARTINGLLDRIASYMDQNRDFIANAAHELRTPLAAIGTALEQAMAGERPAEDRAARLADVAEECAGLTALVNQLLLLAEGDAGRLVSEGEVSRLDEAARRSVDMFAGAAEACGVELEFTAAGPARVRGAEHHLRQIVNNLLDNALKFTLPGGRVAVSVDAAGGRAELRVTDTGTGIAAEDLPRIFERFYQADRSRGREGRRGTGLGLSICAAIVAALGGEVRAESSPGAGSTFLVTLPLCPGPPAAAG